MAVEFLKSVTRENLMRAFAGESQARNRYTFAAQQANKQQLFVIEKLFEFVANQEKEHAERFFKFLEGGCLEITAAFPAGTIRSTDKNLALAVDGEYEEWHDLYPEFAEIAREEGFTNL